MDDLALARALHVVAVVLWIGGVGSRPISCSIWREVRMILLIVSIMCTGMRMVRA